jgi:hypothetical protein
MCFAAAIVTETALVHDLYKGLSYAALQHGHTLMFDASASLAAEQIRQGIQVLGGLMQRSLRQQPVNAA